jgi:hypothetical protein
MFKLGDHVRKIAGGNEGLTGVVTGFGGKTRDPLVRMICLSAFGKPFNLTVKVDSPYKGMLGNLQPAGQESDDFVENWEKIPPDELKLEDLLKRTDLEDFEIKATEYVS